LHGASSVNKRVVQRANRYGAKLKGAVGVSESDLRKAIRLGVAKINIDTDLRLAFTLALREFYAKNRSSFDPRDALLFAQGLVKQTAIEKMKLFGAKNKAKR